METGWLEYNGSWYYLNTNGAMETGWLEYNGSWYY
ncbi:choline-binding protein, partial [Streptococcus pneumoniae]